MGTIHKKAHLEINKSEPSFYKVEFLTCFTVEVINLRVQPINTRLKLTRSKLRFHLAATCVQ